MFFKSKKVLGLDIGTSSIKIAELDLNKNGAKLTSFGVLPTPANTIANGEILDSSILSESIKGILKQMHTKREKVSAGIWGNAVIVKRISLPQMEESLLNEQIRWEAEQYIPYEIHEINLEYHILNTNTSNDSMDILLVAAKKEVIISYLEAIDLANLECHILDVSGFALANCYFMNHGKQNTDILALLDIGAATTNFVVIDHGEIVFSRDISTGGFLYTSEIQKNLGVSTEEAEGFKIDAANDRPAPAEVMEIIQVNHENVCDEINRSIDFYGATTSDNPIHRLHLTGGASITPGLKDKITQITGIEAVFFNPLSKINYDQKMFSNEYIGQIAPLSAVSLGLGMREAGDR